MKLDELTFKLLPAEQKHSEYDWINIDCGSCRVGKVRCIAKNKALTIYSINIFPEFSGRGYGKETVEMFKQSFDTIIADRVRFKAIGFWIKMGFVQNCEGNFIYEKKS